MVTKVGVSLYQEGTCSSTRKPLQSLTGPMSNQSRRGFHLRRLQVTLSAAKLGARVGAAHEKARPGGICLCNHRRQDQGTWGLAREDAREGARNHTRGRP